MHASVNTFKHEYLCNQLADWNEILSEASLGWGKGSVSVDPDWIRTLVSMATDSSDRVIMGKKRAKIEKEKNDQTGTQTYFTEYSRIPVLLSTGNGAFFILGT